MTVIVSKPAVNLREELASLRNQGGYQEQQFYFDGLVTNGTFDADTSGWTAANSATVTWQSGKMRVDGSVGTANQTISTVVGKTYIVSADLFIGTSTSVAIYVSTTNSTAQSFASVGRSSDGNASVSFTATATTTYIIARVNVATSTYIEVDNISVFEVDANDDVVHRMPKGWVPKDVYEDGLLQREGSAHDYEVVYDGFDYYVKPTVAPTATTQTCVIGVRK